DGARPGLLELLPAAGRKPLSESFFHDAVHLNNRFFVASDNILNLGPKTECALAEYAGGDSDFGVLLVVRYPDAGKAAEAAALFRKSYVPEADSDGAALTENKNWTMLKIKDALLAVVFDASSKEYAGRLAAAAFR
ncbi:MAG: hypothetical protein JW843_04420, partial [Candidatus Aminicenantes bacterium]|nr:hypothetical protein [Candidatus Aminicenantes bacterium]